MESTKPDLTGLGPVSVHEFVKAIARVRRSFNRVKQAVQAGDLERTNKAVRSLGRGLAALNDVFEEDVDGLVVWREAG